MSAGTCSITASQAGNTNYAAATDVSQSFAIGQATQTVSFAKPSDVTFAPGGTRTLTATGGASALPVTFASTTSGVCTTGGTNGATVTYVSAGTCSITASQAGNTNYAAAADVSQSFAIGQGTQTVSFAKPSDVTFAPGGTRTLTATGGASALPVTFASTTTGVCTTGGTNGATVTHVSVGTCSITASQAGNTNYAAAADVLAVVRHRPSHADDQFRQAERRDVHAGRDADADGDRRRIGSAGDVRFDHNGRVHHRRHQRRDGDARVGGHLLDHGLAGGQYELRRRGGRLAVVCDRQSHADDQLRQAERRDVHAGRHADADGDRRRIGFAGDVRLDHDRGLHHGRHQRRDGDARVGWHLLDHGLAGGQYELRRRADVSQSFAIGKATQTISFAKPSDVVFTPGGMRTLAATGGASGLPVTFASTTSGVCTTGGSNGATVTHVSVGTCSITASQAGNTNYAAAADVSQSFTIGQATQTISFAKPADQVYGPGKTLMLVASGGASGNPVVFTSGGTSVCTVSGSTVTLRASGSCSITANQAGNANFAPAPAVVQTFAVTLITTTTTLTSSNTAPLMGAPVTFTATVTQNTSGSSDNTLSSAPLTGAVTFTSNGIVLCGNVPLANGQASCTTAFNAPGAYAVAAQYSGGGDTSSSTSSLVTQTVIDQRVKTAETISKFIGHRNNQVLSNAPGEGRQIDRLMEAATGNRPAPTAGLNGDATAPDQRALGSSRLGDGPDATDNFSESFRQRSARCAT